MNTASLASVSATPSGAEQDGFGLRGVDDDTDDDVGPLGRFRRRRRANTAVRDEPRDGVIRTSQPVTSNPARRSEVAMPKPIEPSPMTAMRGFGDADSVMRRFPWFLDGRNSRERLCLWVSRLGRTAKA